mmetsp:Transcript_7578/g.11239  ORF Transcript_7578/g.11239 Transcript_7578/m.11239 type:complete len:446 (+) Transcript_7578:170-1507(+)
MGIITDFEYLEFNATCLTGATSNDHIAPWWVAFFFFLVGCVIIIAYGIYIMCSQNRNVSPFVFKNSLNFLGLCLLLCLIQLFRWKAVIPLLGIIVLGTIIGGFSSPEKGLVESSREPLKPRNIYMDFSKPMEMMYLTFILQVMLTVVYVLSVLNSSDDGMPCFNQTWAYTLMWLTIGLRSIYFTLDYFYRSPNYLSDKTIWQNMRKVIEENEEPGGEKLMVTDDNTWVSIGYHKEITKFEYKFRYVLDLIMNGCVNHILTVLMVIQSANGNFTDFVLNFVAAKFIIELDDYPTWNYDTKFWIVKFDEEGNLIEEENNQSKDSVGDEESNKPSDSTLLGKRSNNQTHTSIQEDLSKKQSFANQDQELAASEVPPSANQVKVQTLTNEVQTLKDEVLKHKNEGQTLKSEVQTLKNEFQALLTTLQERGISHHETKHKNSGSIKTPST